MLKLTYQLSVGLLILSILSFSHCSNSSSSAGNASFPAQFNQLPPGVTAENIPQDIPGSNAEQPRGIIALKSAWILHNTQISSDIFVLGTCAKEHTTNGCLDQGSANNEHRAAELTFGKTVSSAAGKVIKANHIRMKGKADIQSNLSANTFDLAHSATVPNKQTPVGAQPILPPFLKGTPGSQNVTESDIALAPGQYGILTIKNKKSLTLAGGYYAFQKAEIGTQAKLTCATQCIVLVKEFFNAKAKFTLGAASNNPDDFLLFIEGNKPTPDYDFDKDDAGAFIGNSSTVTANIYAPNTLLWIKYSSVIRGNLIARWVRIGYGSQVTGGQPPSAYVKLFEAGVPNSIEIPGKVKLEVPACALTEDTVITVQPKPDAGLNRRGQENWFFYADTAVEFAPSGLEFSCPVGLSQYYDPEKIQAGADPRNLMAFWSEDNLHYQLQPGSPDLLNKKLDTSIRHFTVYLLATPVVSTSHHTMIAKKDNIVYGVTYSTQVYVYDVMNPDAAQVIQTINVPQTCSSQNIHGIKREGDRLYVFQYCWLGYYQITVTTYDIANAAAPQFLARAELPGGRFWYTEYSHLHAGALYAHVFGTSWGELGKVNLSNPAAPTVQFLTSTPNSLESLWGNGNHIYHSIYNGGIQVFQGSPFSNTGVILPKLLPTDNISAMAFTNNAMFYVERLDSATYPTYLVKYDMLSGTSFTNQKLVALSNYSPNATVSLNYVKSLATHGSRILMLGWASDMANSYSYAASLQDTATIPVLEDNGIFPTNQLAVNRNAIFEFPYAYIANNGSPALKILAFQPPAEPPVVVSVTPADGATNVPISTPISITFGQQMNPATLTATTTTACTGAVQVSADNFVTCVPMTSAAGVMSNGGQTVTYTPLALTLGAIYKIKLTTFIQALNGSFLSGAYTQTNGFELEHGSIPTGNANQSRYHHTATLLADGRVLITGGFGNVGVAGAGYLSNCEIFDPAGNLGAGNFAPILALASARAEHSATLLADGRVLILGGRDATDALSSAEIFDPAGNSGSGVFLAAGSMIVKRLSHTATLLSDGRVLIAGGTPNAGILSSVEIFDPAGNAGAGSFTLTASMSSKRLDHSATRLSDGRVLIAGGFSGLAYLSSAEIFDPTGNSGTGSFSGTGVMTSTRSIHSAILLLDGRVVLIGGANATGSIATTEIFDPGANFGIGNFIATASMLTSRQSHTATRLPNGRILITGGLSLPAPSSIALSSAELLNPLGNSGLGSIMSSNAMLFARFLHRATLLSDGRILITGGLTNYAILSAAEIYQ